MTTPKTAQVIGGGIVGLNIALALQERGIAVTLVDPEARVPNASWGNIGHIAVEQIEPLASQSSIFSLPKRLYSLGGPAAFPLSAIHNWLPFGLRLIAAASPSRFASGKKALASLMTHAIPAWRRRLAEVKAADLFKANGHIVAWSTMEAARLGRANWSKANTGTATWRDLAGAEYSQLRTTLMRPPADAIWFDGTAQISDPGDVLNALRAAFRQRGGNTLRAKLKTLPQADVTIVCAGMGSADLLRPIGHRVPIIAERGYHIQSQSGRWPVELPPIIFEDKAVVATSFRGGLRATSFVEFAHANTPPDPKKWKRLRRQAHALALPFGDDTTEWMGARPTLPDYLPAIGKSARAERLYYAFGHQHLGLTLGPITGEIIADMVTGCAPAVDTAPFDISRFERIAA